MIVIYEFRFLTEFAAQTSQGKPENDIKDNYGASS